MQHEELIEREAADWMKAELMGAGSLYHADVVSHLEAIGANTLILERDDGGTSLHPRLLAAFKGITLELAVWDRAEKAWRLREISDGEGRLA